MPSVKISFASAIGSSKKLFRVEIVYVSLTMLDLRKISKITQIIDEHDYKAWLLSTLIDTQK